jgi:hypothetical protein
VRASGALCRAADSSARAPIPRLRAPCRVVSASPHPCGLRPCGQHPCGHQRHRDFRCARSAVTAAGLGRRTTADQCAFHRFDPSFATQVGCCAAQVGSAPLVVHARSLAPHPVACHDPCLPRQRREVRFKLSLAPDPASRPRRSLRERCVSPTSATDSTKRAPSGPFDSRLRLACIRLTPGACNRRLILGQGPHGSGGWEPRIRLPDEPPSGASLDGESPASASAATLTCASEVYAPRSHGHPTPRSPGGASIVAPLRRASRSGRFQPRTEHAT